MRKYFNLEYYPSLSRKVCKTFSFALMFERFSQKKQREI